MLDSWSVGSLDEGKKFRNFASEVFARQLDPKRSKFCGLVSRRSWEIPNLYAS